MSEFIVVGKDVPRLDAIEKVTGRARFTSDFQMGGMLYAKVLKGPYPHAKIVNIDTSKAEHLTGVRAILVPRDVPPVPISPLLGDQYALCRDNIVRSVGDPVAAVAADTVDIAEEALELIEVDYEELPAVFDVEEAFRKDPPVVVHPDLPKYKPLSGLPVRPDPERPNVCQTYRVRSGDVEKGFQEADLIIENRFTTARIQHCQMEPHIADAWFESDGSLTVRSTIQAPWILKHCLGNLFTLSPSKVRILSAYIGGSFGGRGWIRTEAIVALLAQKSGRPVRSAFTREEMFTFGGNRVPYVIYIKDGVKRDGTLIAREIKAILALGIYGEFGILLVKRAAAGAIGTYRVSNFKFDSYGVYTNMPLTGPFRGFGCAEIEWPIEQQMDIIAEKLGIDPVEVRMKNILNEGDRDASGMITLSIGVKECLDKVAEWIGWGEKTVEEGGPWKRGKGIAIGNKSVKTGDTSLATVKVWEDSVIEVRHSSMEEGQGIKTTLAQIAAEQFGVSPDKVRVVSGDTAICPFDEGTIASRSLVHNGHALMAACQDAKRQLFKIAAPKLGAAPEELETTNGKIYVKAAPEKSLSITDLFTPSGLTLEEGEILGRGSYTSPLVPEDPETGQGERGVFCYAHGAHAVEVAVNIETGEIKVLRIAGAFDGGKIVNPKIVEGQIDGGIGMGIGSAFEEVIFDGGVVLNPSFADYYIPTIMDLPSLDNTKSMIVEAPHREGPYGAKGVGEAVLIPVAPAIANAIYNAVGVRIKDLPLSSAKVLEGIKKIQKDQPKRILPTSRISTSY